MVEKRCFVFRTDPNDFVRNELREGRLRQGWSPPGTSLLNAGGEERDAEEWKQAYKKAWGVDPSPRRHGILRRMLAMKQGDLVFCPKVPDYAHFTIAEVSGGYRFEVAPSEGDFGHTIPVHPVQGQRVVSNWHNNDSQAICELFRSAYFRGPVTQVQDDKEKEVLSSAKRLLKQEDTDTPQDRDKIREKRYVEGRRKAADSLMEYINTEWGFDQFEAAVGEAFRRKGYEWLRGKSTRNGGDADHVFSLPMPGFDDETLDRIPLLIVQVKHKKDIDYDDIRGVNQLVKWKPYEGEEVRFKVLFSSADSFTENCQKIAEAYDVILICGTDAGLFML